MPKGRGSKSLSEAGRTAVQAFVRELVKSQFNGNIKAAAEKIGLSYAQLHGLHEGTTGGGSKSHEALSIFTGKSIDEITGRRVVASIDPEDSPHLGNVAGYAEQERNARRENPEIPEWAFVKARRRRNVSVPQPLTAEFAAAQALDEWRWTPDDVKMALEKKALDAQVQALRTRHENKLKKEREALATPAPDAAAEPPKKPRGK